MLMKCKYCNISFEKFNGPEKANHSRWCEKNPKRNSYKTSMKGVLAMNAAKKENGNTNQFTKAANEGLEIPVSKLKDRPGKSIPHTEETKKKLSIAARASPHRRLRRKMIEYKGVMLDSSWELALAERLDELNIVWERPGPIVWFDEEGNNHHYFPDFYLPSRDLYLDPKNPRAIQVQKKKLNVLKKQLPNLMILDSLEKCQQFS